MTKKIKFIDPVLVERRESMRFIKPGILRYLKYARLEMNSSFNWYVAKTDMNATDEVVQLRNSTNTLLNDIDNTDNIANIDKTVIDQLGKNISIMLHLYTKYGYRQTSLYEPTHWSEDQPIGCAHIHDMLFTMGIYEKDPIVKAFNGCFKPNGNFARYKFSTIGEFLQFNQNMFNRIQDTS